MAPWIQKAAFWGLLCLWGFLFLLSCIGLLLAAYFLFGVITARGPGFDPHPILPGANFSYLLTLLVYSPVWMASFLVNFFCWIVFMALRPSRKSDKSGTEESQQI